MQCHNRIGKDSLKESMGPNCYNCLTKCCAKSGVASQAEVSHRHGAGSVERMSPGPRKLSLLGPQKA